MSRIDDILKPARVIIRGTAADPTKTAEAKAEEIPSTLKSIRTYYRRRDGLVTQRKWRTMTPEDRAMDEIFFNGCAMLDCVDTCRASTKGEAFEIFMHRPHPENSVPLRRKPSHA
jgi:hypothetical protein